MDVRAVLADVATLGPFFVVRTESSDRVDPTWRPITALSADPAPVRDRIAHARRVLDCDDRVAASIVFQGLAAVLVSAPAAAVVLHGILPELTPRRLRWRPAAGGPLPLSLPEPAGRALAATPRRPPWPRCSRSCSPRWWRPSARRCRWRSGCCGATRRRRSRARSG